MGKTAVQIKSPAFRDEYEKLVFRMNSPRVVIDNSVCATATIVMVDSARKHRILLEALQVFTDLNLSIKKGYITSDGKWLMDVFHVTDLDGNKLTDESVISHIKQSLGTIDYERSTSITGGLTALELTGNDRIGLLSEIFAVLSDLQCNVVESKVWTHNNRIAALIFVEEIDAQQVQNIDARLKLVLNTDYTDTDSDITRAKTFVSMDVTMNTERRLHQLMYADRDYEMKASNDSPLVTVLNLVQSGYSVMNVQCRDRNKLLFDVVCTLTDMEYFVFHATLNTDKDQAYMEFYIRHTDGNPFNSEAEQQRVIQCLRASIQRRGSQGVKLELSTEDSNGLLADVTRTFRENGLNVTRAEISTTSDTVQNTFYVTDSNGNVPDSKIIESVRAKMGPSNLKVKELPMAHCKKINADSGDVLLSIGRALWRKLYSMGLTRSSSVVKTQSLDN